MEEILCDYVHPLEFSSASAYPASAKWASLKGTRVTLGGMSPGCTERTIGWSRQSTQESKPWLEWGKWGVQQVEHSGTQGHGGHRGSNEESFTELSEQEGSKEGELLWSLQVTLHLIFLEIEKNNNEIMVPNSKISIKIFFVCFLSPGTELTDLVSSVTRS